MRQKCITLATVFSLALCLATGVLWVRSASRVDALGVFRAGHSVLLVSAGGRLRCVWIAPLDYVPRVRFVSYGPGESPFLLWAIERAVPVAPDEAGFTLTRGTFEPNVSREPLSDVFIGAPYWFVIALAGAAPLYCGAGWLGQWRRRRKWRPAGCCGACGYDLRGTPDRCPECGTVARHGRVNRDSAKRVAALTGTQR